MLKGRREGLVNVRHPQPLESRDGDLSSILSTTGNKGKGVTEPNQVSSLAVRVP